MAEKRNFYLMRAEKNQTEVLKTVLEQLELSLKSTEFGKDAMSKALFVQLLVHVNRIMLRDTTDKDDAAYAYDPKIANTLSYINDNISKELTVDELAGRVFMSKYYFMRRFRESTGYTVHSYILQKRLILSVKFIRSGVPLMQAAVKCGFSDYSSFSRAFKKTFHVSPGKFK